MKAHGLAMALALLACQALCAHEIRPASIDILQTADAVTVTWRQPVVGDYSLALAPTLSSGWLTQPPQEQQATAQTLTRTWVIAKPTVALEGQQLGVQGLDRTLTDVFVTVHWRGGETTTALLKPLQSTTTLAPTRGRGTVSSAYLRLGFAHILGGYDHLLYLLGLVLLVPGLRALVGVITAFTIAHSITLALSVTDWVRIPAAPIEALIALSVVFVAVEVYHAQAGKQHLTHRYPWLIAFLFGLLHGFGFAAALRSIGFAEGALAGPLLLFNVGIELGQLLFILVATGCLALLLRWAPANAAAVQRTVTIAMGGLAAWWFFERVAVLGQTA